MLLSLSVLCGVFRHNSVKAPEQFPLLLSLQHGCRQITLRLLTVPRDNAIGCPFSRPSRLSLRLVKTFLMYILVPTPDLQLERLFIPQSFWWEMQRCREKGVCTGIDIPWDSALALVPLTAPHGSLLPCKRLS